MTANIDRAECALKANSSWAGAFYLQLIESGNLGGVEVPVLMNAAIRIRLIGIFKRFSGNRFVQRLLDLNVSFAQELMGIGSGGDVESSGEKAVLGLLRSSSPAPYCIFDVGSNKGQYLGLIRSLLPEKDLNVHCFEPGLHTYGLLESSLEDANREGVVLNNVALGSATGEMTLYYDEPGSGLASLTMRRLEHFGIAFDQTESVAVDTVDNYCRTNGIDRIDLLKVDVEGHEMDVFNGAAAMFRSGSIGMATFEFGGCNIDTRTYVQDFYYFFKDVGMQVLRVTPSGYLKPIESYREIDEQFRTTNFVAVNRG